MTEHPTERTGLASMVAGAAAGTGGHLVLADWLDEHLNRPDLAAVYRLTKEDPREPAARERTRYREFRYEFLDGEVMLYLALWRVSQPYQQGKKPPEPSGHLIGMCVTAEGGGDVLRWVRWLPHDGATAEDEVLALWARLGAEVPRMPPEK